MFQYNLKTLLLVMLGVCVLTWFFFVLPGEISAIVLVCLMVIVPSAVVAGLLYFRGYPQAFAIGCVPPILLVSVFLFFEGPRRWRFGPGDDLEGKIAMLICLIVIMAAGATSAGVRWLAVWSQQPGIETKTFPGLARQHDTRSTTEGVPYSARSLNPDP
jgi:hypothetical protein